MAEEQTPADKFEDSIRDLLRELGFQKVNGGKNFKIGDQQIDACGVCEGHLIIVECTTQRANLKSKIDQWKGQRSSIRRGLCDCKDYRKYNNDTNLIFVFATNTSKIDNYADYNGQHPATAVWNSKLINYYKAIAKAVPFRAKYDVLSDLGFDINVGEKVSIPAFKINFNNTEMFNFFIEPSELVKISYVARRETGKKDYYQRMIEPSRLSGIKKFLAKGGIFPTNIIISINKPFKFSELKMNMDSRQYFPEWLTVGVIDFPKSYQSCWVIDGQHRLFSFDHSLKQKLSVLAFGNIDLNKQTRYFVEVNKHAKPISAMLLWDLEGDLRPNSREGIISNSVKLMNTLEPFENMISIPSIGKGKISMVTLCNSLDQVDFADEDIKTGRLRYKIKNPFINNDYQKTADNIARSVCSYFKAIDELIPDNTGYIREFIFDNGGASVLIYLYKVIICIEGSKPDTNKIKRYLKPLIMYLSRYGIREIKEYKKKSSSEGGKTMVLDDFLKQITAVNKEVVNYITESNDLLDNLIDFESSLRNFVETELNKEFNKTYMFLEKDVCKRVEQKLGRKPDSSAQFCESLTIGDLSIILTGAMWNRNFKSTLIKEPETDNINDMRFPSEEIFKANLKFAVSARNNLAHKKGHIITTDDKESLFAFLRRMNTILKNP